MERGKTARWPERHWERMVQEWERAAKVAGAGDGRVGMCPIPTREPKDTGTPRMVLGKLSPDFPAARRASGQIKPGLAAAWIYPRCLQNVPATPVPRGKRRQGHR